MIDPWIMRIIPTLRLVCLLLVFFVDIMKIVSISSLISVFLFSDFDPLCYQKLKKCNQVVNFVIHLSLKTFKNNVNTQ
jgi:hypothetical protein